MVWSDRRMRGLPTGCMTGLTVSARCKGLADCKAYKCAVGCIMAVRAVSYMCGCIKQCIRMTRGTVISAGSRYKAAVIWRRCMDSAPAGTVTCCTVAAGGEVFAYCCARQGTVTRMTGSTGIMGHRISAGQRWWITMA